MPTATPDGESHRHANIASFVAKEWATPGRRIAGHLVPEGTPILLANTIAFLDEKYFPDPSKYDRPQGGRVALPLSRCDSDFAGSTPPASWMSL